MRPLVGINRCKIFVDLFLHHHFLHQNFLHYNCLCHKYSYSTFIFDSEENKCAKFCDAKMLMQNFLWQKKRVQK